MFYAMVWPSGTTSKYDYSQPPFLICYTLDLPSNQALIPKVRRVRVVIKRAGVGGGLGTLGRGLKGDRNLEFIFYGKI